MPEFYVSKLGKGYKVRPNITLGEIQCKDGSDHVLAMDATLDLVQKTRDFFGGKVTINSFYRTPAHDKKQGGSGSGPHTRGWACDAVYYDKAGKAVPAKTVASLWLAWRVKGIEIIGDSAIHCDPVRTDEWRTVKKVVGGKNTYPTWAQAGISISPYTGQAAVPAEPSSAPSTSWKIGSKDAAAVKNIQNALKCWGYSLLVDGSFGPATEARVKDFQKSVGLVADGVVGANTWSVLQTKL